MLVPYHFSWNNLLLVMVFFVLNVKFYLLQGKNTAKFTALVTVTDGHF